jgi:hypothetical protein
MEGRAKKKKLTPNASSAALLVGKAGSKSEGMRYERLESSGNAYGRRRRWKLNRTIDQSDEGLGRRERKLTLIAGINRPRESL